VAALSSLGFCASSAMVVPRYVETFAQDAFLPRMFARRSPRFDTPVVAIVAVSLCVIPLAIKLNFVELADVSNVAVVAQYVSTSIAICVWRIRDPGSASFKLPLGWTIPALAVGGSVLFLFNVSTKELAFGGELLVAGLLFGAATRFFRRAPAASQ
jgi:amino acid transporter